MYFVACLLVFLAAYLVNATTISVLYHRGLAHRAVELHPRTRRLAARAGIWLTGLDAKAWVCMHRRHHAYSDSEKDPHSPTHFGLVGVLMAQYRSYERTLLGLAHGRTQYTSYVQDLDFPTSWINRRGLWFLPYGTHLLLATGLSLAAGGWLLGTAYFLGIMSHPIEGWIVNSLGHAVGGRNFDTRDNSRNNTAVAVLMLGEGLQNNHHRYPASARFSYHPSEIDPGFAICRLLEAAGALTINREGLIPRPEGHLDEAA